MNQGIIKLNPQQMEKVFQEQLDNICGDYKIRDGVVHDVTWCGRDDCNGHEEVIKGKSQKDKVRLAAIALRQLF